MGTKAQNELFFPPNLTLKSHTVSHIDKRNGKKRKGETMTTTKVTSLDLSSRKWQNNAPRGAEAKLRSVYGVDRESSQNEQVGARLNGFFILWVQYVSSPLLNSFQDNVEFA